MKKKTTLENLHQLWVHSHEEDTESEMVFRPASFKFPPSRGRRSFELKPDGNLVEGGIAPTDGRRESQGTWKLVDGDKLALDTGSCTKPKTLQIVSADKDRLVVKK